MFDMAVNTNNIVIRDHPVNIYLLKVINRNTRKRYKISSKLTVKTGFWSHLLKKFFMENFIFCTVVNLELVFGSLGDNSNFSHR